jgi:hypothetical protein
MREDRFDVRITIKPGWDNEDRRHPESFWKALVKERRFNEGTEPTTEALEERLTSWFGEHLRSRLAFHFSHVWQASRTQDISPLEEEQRKHISLISFRLFNLHYGSLDFSIEIAGLKHLVALFEGNFDLFDIFLSTYVPVAFAEAIGYRDLNPTNIDIFSSPTLRSAFSAYSTVPQPVTTTPSPLMDPRMRWIWMITNGSLVVPILLSLAVLYVGARLLEREHDALSSRLDAIQKKEAALLDAQTQRLKVLEAGLYSPRSAELKTTPVTVSPP